MVFHVIAIAFTRLFLWYSKWLVGCCYVVAMVYQVVDMVLQSGC